MDTPENTILRKIHGAMMGARIVRESSSWRPGRILVQTDRGETIEITARQLAPHDPDALELAETLAAIDRGDVE